MSRVAAPNPPRGGGPPYASQHYNNQSQQATYAQAHHSTYPQQSQRPRAPAHRVPKYTVGTGTSKDGKETETLTLGDSDDDDDQTPQAGPSNGAYSTANHHLNGYPPQVYPAAEQPRAGAKRGRNDGQPSQAQAHSGATTSKKRKTGGVAGADPYGGYDQPQVSIKPAHHVGSRRAWPEESSVSSGVWVANPSRVVCTTQVSVTDKEGHYIYKAGNYIYDEDNPPKQCKPSRSARAQLLVQPAQRSSIADRSALVPVYTRQTASAASLGWEPSVRWSRLTRARAGTRPSRNTPWQSRSCRFNPNFKLMT